MLKSDKVKIRILKILSDKDAHSTNELAIKCRINAMTVQRNCLFLSQLGLLKISVDKEKNIRTYLITPEGLRAIGLFKESQLEHVGALHDDSVGLRRQ